MSKDISFTITQNKLIFRVACHFIRVLIHWFKKLNTFSYVLNLKIDVVPKASHAVVIRQFSLNEAPLGLFKFIFDYSQTCIKRSPLGQIKLALLDR